MAEKIPGVSSYRDALRLLIQPQKPGVELNEGGKGPRLSPSVLEKLKELRRIHHDAVDGENPVWNKGLGVGCPVFHTKGSGDAKSGMQSIFEAYLRVFEKVDDQLHGKTKP
jgi:hypothetical protein